MTKADRAAAEMMSLSDVARLRAALRQAMAAMSTAHGVLCYWHETASALNFTDRHRMAQPTDEAATKVEEAIAAADAVLGTADATKDGEGET